MKLKIFVTATVIATAVLLVFSQIKRQAFAPATDFPRQALIYAQIADLPAFIKLWNKSELKEKYQESENFRDFKNNHLGRKLLSRWQEFSDAAGFPIDLDVLSKLAGNQSSLALYDAGKLEFVFIAPVSDEVFTATKFAQSRDKFTEETLSDGATIYRAAVEADRGRQKQELIFTQAKGRFILTTSEKLIIQTLKNINGDGAKNRLIDDPAFKFLSEKIESHAATVWVNQTALNDDYYFKHYWLMSDVADLKNIRAGIFDFEIGTEKIIERRKFLLDKTVDSSPVEISDAEKTLTFLPSDIPYYRLQSVNPKTINEAIEKTIFSSPPETNKKSRKYNSAYSTFNSYDDYSNVSYDSLGGKFDETIDETEDNDKVESREIEIDFSKILKSSKPQTILTLTKPQILPPPMFVEFQRATVFHLASPKSFDRENFETAMAQKLSAQVLIDAPDIKLNWESKSENTKTWRELKLPKLEWNISYATIGNELIVANDSDFLCRILTDTHSAQIEKQTLSPFTSLSVINLGEKENDYDRIFDEINRKEPTDDFFNGDITSLLDAISRVKRIEVKENHSQNTLDEEITFNF